jgi:ESCRT-II complex subunit VPS25
MCIMTGKILAPHLSNILEAMVQQNLAVYEPPKQTRSVLVFWRLPEEWAEVLYDWVWHSVAEISPSSSLYS